MKVDKTLAASVALHVLVLGWGLISFSTRSLEAPPEESLPIDVISADQLSKITAGIKTGEKDKPKPLVEKVAEATPVDDAVGKISKKQPIVTDAAPDPTPPVDKPVEKKPDPPKPVTESKPKEDPKPIEKKPDPPKIDPIAEALKSEAAKKPKPKAEAKSTPPPPTKKREYKFDTETIAALVDKRDPTRQAVTGAVLNASASLGTSRGTAATLSQSELAAMRARLHDLWNVPPGIENPGELNVTVRIWLNRDRRLAAAPQVVSVGSSARSKAAADAAIRALLQGQPYTMLRDETYDQWKYMDIDFGPDMSSG
ncbi:protein TolA [Bradyrhizobium sp.]|uniref:protein TolA n=1 Tax=Bradyrhizobium sp. TaxID=376 RepID=UPI003C3FCC94